MSPNIPLTPLLVAVATGLMIALLGPINALLQPIAGTWGLSTVVHVVGLTVSVLGLLLIQRSSFLGWALEPSLCGALLMVATLGLLTCAFLLYRGLQQGLPWYSYLGGVIGLLVVLGTVFSIQRLGVANAMILILASQIAAAAVVGYLGLLGQAANPLSLLKVVGLGVMVLGAVVAVRN
ncbi:DMT family transporter [Calidithermus timidus]|jgi:transporter family-2 protein|uniref:DMT family transporter n=1 Tax=Calidithermus timidus TaxID=307124 RepID=UPI0003756BC7|nr:DMT family transporter [Calidithermus timidus]